MTSWFTPQFTTASENWHLDSSALCSSVHACTLIILSHHIYNVVDANLGLASIGANSCLNSHSPGSVRIHDSVRPACHAAPAWFVSKPSLTSAMPQRPCQWYLGPLLGPSHVTAPSTFSFIYGMFPFILLSRPVYELLRRPMMTYAPPTQLKLL